MESLSSTTRVVRSVLHRPNISGPSCNSQPGKDGGLLRDVEFNKWKTVLFAELVTVQEYYHGIDSTDLLDCRVGGLSVAQMKAVESTITGLQTKSKRGPDGKGRTEGCGAGKLVGRRLRRRTVQPLESVRGGEPSTRGCRNFTTKIARIVPGKC